MPETSSGRSWVRWLYNHNPFYFISAMLMLFAVRASYGKLEIGLINCCFAKRDTLATSFTGFSYETDRSFTTPAVFRFPDFSPATTLGAIARIV